MGVTLVSAADLDRDRLAALFTAVYEGYWHPIEIDVATLERMVSTYDLDLDASCVARATDGNDVGLAMLARRGGESWIGGMGVVATHRGHGLGDVLTRALLEAAADAGCTRTRLEVLEQNAPAIAIYRRLGFAPLRDVAVWSLAEPPTVELAPAIDLDAALGALAEARLDDPWQRSLATISRMCEAGAPLTAYGLRGGIAVCALADGRASLLSISADASTAPGLLRAPFADGATALLWLNGDVDGPVADALVAAGAAQLGRQHELQVDPTTVRAAPRRWAAR